MWSRAEHPDKFFRPPSQVVNPRRAKQAVAHATLNSVSTPFLSQFHLFLAILSVITLF